MDQNAEYWVSKGWAFANIFEAQLLFVILYPSNAVLHDRVDLSTYSN